MADADLVLEGGGVKGSALVGALSALEAAADPYTFHRVAGTSAGAIVASFLASGMNAGQIKKVMDELDFSRFEDKEGILARIPGLGPAFGLLVHEGLFAGDFMHQWLTETLAGQGVKTWADLREDDPGSALPPSQRYKLVVIVSDVSRGLMLRLPWDYETLLGVDPDTVPVADAVRASASIPFFFRPWKMAMNAAVTGHDHIVCTDGGMLSNFPIDVFDRRDDKPSRWPTMGVKLSGQQSLRTEDWKPDNNGFELAKSLLSTMIGAHDRAHINDPQASSRTVFVDTSRYRATDFHLSAEDKTTLYTSGFSSAQRFLNTWDWEQWKKGYYTT
ncbi:MULTISPECIES: patatin-like phospholipase family protein [Arthrobacter]|uniref:Patatin-like phospholipase family protein n=2 Tax=Arthrobacter TaxID=1663 RepID=A0ABU9KMX3_9MICC|nr:patatin-like phospholipase family protein [Arthrobacter sp. YJM1]MDP5228093.1 patatin-like phospholipase family protein [Arthrobacter sp. YJM1]